MENEFIKWADENGWNPLPWQLELMRGIDEKKRVFLIGSGRYTGKGILYKFMSALKQEK